MSFLRTKMFSYTTVFLASLCLIFFTYKIRIIVIPVSKNCCEEYAVTTGDLGVVVAIVANGIFCPFQVSVMGMQPMTSP